MQKDKNVKEKIKGVAEFPISQAASVKQEFDSFVNRNSKTNNITK